MNLDKLLNINFTWDNRKYILGFLPKETCVKFAIFCAEQVFPIFESKFPNDDRPRRAIESAKIWLVDPSEENRAAASAAYAVSAAAAAAYAAAAASAAYAASAAAAAAAAAYAVYVADAAVAYTAAYAVYVADAAADPESTKQEQMNYLRELILESLTEEQREDWLLVASL